MKKLFLIPVAALALSLFACNADVSTEEVGVGTNKGIEALEALSDTTNANTVADTTKK